MHKMYCTVFCLGFLWVAWDPKKQGWHDKMAKTLVVETGDKPKTGLAIAIVSLVYLLGLLLIILMVAVLGFGTWYLINQAKQNPEMFKDNKDMQQMMQDLEKQMQLSITPSYQYEN